MSKISERSGALAKLSKEEETALKTKYEAQLKEAMTPFMAGIMKASMNPEISKVLGQFSKKFSN